MTIGNPDNLVSVGQDDSWWVRGLSLSERVAAGPVLAPAEPTDRHRRRLDRWRDALDRYGVTARLPLGGVSDADLLALMAEPPHSLADRTVRPQWAVFIEETIATVPVEPAADRSGLSWQAGFGLILAPFAAAAWDLVEPPPAAIADLPALRDGFVERLTDTLIRLAARTLVLELNVFRVTGRLSGDTPGERFTDFVGQLRGRAGLAALLGEYAVLARLVGQACRQSAAAHGELLRRFCADRVALVDSLLDGTDPGRLVEVTACGDAHQGGRAVATLRFDSGARIVYRPRPVGIHRRFNDLVRWLDGHAAGLNLATLAVSERDGYGWVEYALPLPCAGEDDVAAFFRRLGALLALLYALDAADLHHENLVARGDQPLLVDVETVLHPTLPDAGPAGTDPAATALASSVDRITLLPRLLIGANGAVDISGMGGDGGATLPFDVVGWADAGTDEMRLMRQQVPLPPGHNRPRVDDREADPADHLPALLRGFQIGYDAIVEHRAELLDPTGPLAGCATDEIRVLVRASQVYATLRDESTHPDTLRDALDRDRVFDLLTVASAGDPLRQRLLGVEIADLWAGDIPLFTGQPGSTDLWSAGGERFAGAVADPSLDRVLRKVARMGELDRYDQEWLIRAAVATRAEADCHHAVGAVHDEEPPVPPDPARLLAAAGRIADHLVACAFRAGGRANWLGLEPVAGRHWSVRPLGAGLGDGYTGVALFLAHIAALTGNARYAECAREALRAVPPLLSELSADRQRPGLVGCGGFSGLGGIAYGLSQIAGLLADGAIAEQATHAVELAIRALDADCDAGVIDGLAGCLAAAQTIHRATGCPAARTLTVRAAERLAGTAESAGWMADAAGSGFAHGAVGVGWALLRYGLSGGGDRFRELGLATLDRAADLDMSTEDKVAGGWCHGGIGIAFALGAYREHLSYSRIELVTSRLDPVRTGPALANHSLCHGELGRLDALVVAGDPAPDSAGRVLATIERSGARCGTPEGIDSPGLLTGTAGIGYGLLRLGYAERVPSVLLLG